MESEKPQSSFQAWFDTCLVHDEKADVAQRLRQEAQAHFESLCQPSSSPEDNISSPSKSSTVEQDLSNASSSTSNGAIALLVSILDPAFSQNNVPLNHKITARVRAVNCLLGALEGSSSLTYGVRQGVGNFLTELCRAESIEQGNDDAVMIDSGDAYVDGATLTPEEITQQLEAMDRTQQQRPKGGSSPAAEEVRDGAILALTALLQSRLEIFPTLQSQSTCPVKEAIGVVHQSMELRMKLAMLGLTYRCESDDSSNNYNSLNAGDGYETISPGLNVEGLSQLPRMKRSLCFKLLEGALDGVKADTLQLEELIQQQSSTTKEEIGCVFPNTLLKEMSKFASLTSSCLHGETDPRCLLQLLRLLNKMQQILLPLFFSTPAIDPRIQFPTVEVFDAVAPYYPVHFTPPKNDPHGITREMLQDALIAVLCERGAMYSDNSIEDENSNGSENENATMAELSARMFLERLDPPKFTNDYDPPSSPESEEEDKVDALRDLSILLLPSSSTSNTGAHITVAFVSELSSSLARAHEEAVSTDKTTDANSLASRVRKFASSFANSLAPVSVSNGDVKVRHTTLLWEAFVHDATRKLVSNLSSSPQSMHGRSSTAYLAALAAEGGLPTLRKVLDASLPRLLDLLSKHDDSSSADDEKMAAAIRGIAAFMSSCYVALKMWERNNRGVQVHPHPLSKYISQILQKIATALKGMRGKGNDGPLTLAAAGAFESALTAADLSGLEEGDMNVIEELLDLMSTVVLEKVDDAASRDDDTLRKWKKSCARALGAAIATGLHKSEDLPNSGERLESLAQSLLPKVLAGSVCSSKPHLERYDWMVLAGACANGSPNVSEQIVTSLLSSTIDDLQKKVDVRECSPKFQCFSLMALAYLVRCGGPNVGKVFHSLSAPATTPLDVINELCVPLDQESLQDENISDPPKQVTRQLPVGMSHLQLPDSLAKDEEMKNATIQRAYSVMPYLIEAYVCPSSTSSCDNLVAFVDQILPPLSELDEVKLYVAFPLLAAVLNGQNDVWKVVSPSTGEQLQSMTTYLAQFSMSEDHDSFSRSAAASCLFAILIHGGEGVDPGGENIKNLLDRVVYPAVTESVACLQQTFDGASGVTAATDHACTANVEAALNFMALLGCAAACRGGRCSQTADEIASCLVQVACNGSSSAFAFKSLEIEAQQHPILDPASLAFVLPAAAFGSMLSVKNGGPFWRQRIIHKTLPILMKTLQEQATSRSPPALGSLAVVAQMLCSVSQTHLGESKIRQMIPTLIAGLVYFSKNLDVIAQDDKGTKGLDVLSIILAALTKILRISPEDVTKFVGVIIPSLLLLSTCNASKRYTPNQLIALQCLEIVTTHPNARNAVLREKDQVTAALSVIVDHPSKIIRQAVVHVRNVWFTL
ncbi:DNA repair/transcription protein MET18/MMS19-like protein [Skeletonema marinoi]|uniref:MMS19 nucleotide excision repair protein n=1 Tax=Skeletonema marinoi TaxID=267567 RepID=A0AAD8YCQ1_9STRA|nr:DNA repair/transcription protein MET18/MMS19-like protein [Skeletonema marinoi]